MRKVDVEKALPVIIRRLTREGIPFQQGRQMRLHKTVSVGLIPKSNGGYLLEVGFYGKPGKLKGELRDFLIQEGLSPHDFCFTRMFNKAHAPSLLSIYAPGASVNTSVFRVGTMGFCFKKGNDFYFISSGHVFPKGGPGASVKVYSPAIRNWWIKRREIPLGIVVASYRPRKWKVNLLDAALIKVINPNAELSDRVPEGPMKGRRIVLPPEGYVSKQYMKVWKIGKGGIVKEAYLRSLERLVWAGCYGFKEAYGIVGKRQPLAKRGDSGGVVFVESPKSSEVYCIGLVTAVIYRKINGSRKPLETVLVLPVGLVTRKLKFGI